MSVMLAARAVIDSHRRLRRVQPSNPGTDGVTTQLARERDATALRGEFESAVLALQRAVGVDRGGPVHQAFMVDPLTIAKYVWTAYADESANGAQPDDERLRELIRTEFVRRFSG